MLSRGGFELNEIWHKQVQAMAEGDSTYRALGGESYKRIGVSPTIKRHNPETGEPTLRPIAEKAASHLRSKGAGGIAVGKEIRGGEGSYGKVYRGPGPGTVVKIDSGEAEARLASHVLANPDKFGHIRSLPRFHSVHSTPFKHEGRSVHAIHREDLDDLPSSHLSDAYSAVGRAVSDARMNAERAHRKAHDAAKADGTDKQFDRHADYHKRVGEHVDSALDRVHGIYFKGSKIADQFHRVRKDIKHLIGHGIVPCDMSGQNWGSRKGNGEIVMRDVGCYHVHNPKRAA